MHLLFPEATDWDSLHPLVVHFPIGLFMTVPVLIVLAMLIPAHARGISLAALALMCCGVFASFIATRTGELASAFVVGAGKTGEVLEEHSDAAETARNIFCVLTVVFAGVIFVPQFLRKTLSRRVTIIVYVVFLVLYTPGMAKLAQAGHLGGKLVHQFGVRARMKAPDAAPAAKAAE